VGGGFTLEETPMEKDCEGSEGCEGCEGCESCAFEESRWIRVAGKHGDISLSRLENYTSQMFRRV